MGPCPHLMASWQSEGKVLGNRDFSGGSYGLPCTKVSIGLSPLWSWPLLQRGAGKERPAPSPGKVRVAMSPFPSAQVLGYHKLMCCLQLLQP